MMRCSYCRMGAEDLCRCLAEWHKPKEEEMTFTKEKLAELAEAKKWYIENINDERIVFIPLEEKMNNRLLEAATALPHYITALADAERALEAINTKQWAERGLYSNDAFLVFEEIGSHCDEALSTIRQLARGNTDAET